MPRPMPLLLPVTSTLRPASRGDDVFAVIGITLIVGTNCDSIGLRGVFIRRLRRLRRFIRACQTGAASPVHQPTAAAGREAALPREGRPEKQSAVVVPGRSCFPLRSLARRRCPAPRSAHVCVHLRHLRIDHDTAARRGGARTRIVSGAAHPRRADRDTAAAARRRRCRPRWRRSASASDPASECARAHRTPRAPPPTAPPLRGRTRGRPESAAASRRGRRRLPPSRSLPP